MSMVGPAARIGGARCPTAPAVQVDADTAGVSEAHPRGTEDRPMNAPLVQNPPEGLRIIAATERMAEPRGIKGCIFGRSGVGKTAPVEVRGLARPISERPSLPAPPRTPIAPTTTPAA